MRYSVLVCSVSLTAAIALAGATGYAEGIVESNASDSSLIGGLAGVGDMEPVAGSGTQPAVQERADRPSAEEVRASIRANVRQSVPTRDRAATYRTAEVFRNSKVALPLLVADLEPQVIVVPLPMSGLSVGARPSASWTVSSRSMTGN